MTPEEKQEKARVNRIMSKGPIDLPFALLVLLLTAIGVLMVFSASFARAYYEGSVNSGKQKDSQSYTIVWDNLLTFYKTMGRHDVTAMLGHSVERTSYDYMEANGSNYPDDDILVNLGSAATRGAINSNKQSSSLVSLFARVQYKYNNRYLFTGTFRTDGSSRFGKEADGGVKAFGGKKVVKLLDYAQGLDGLPKSDVLKFLLEDNCSIVVRPSGTEPKLKIYVSVSAADKAAAERIETEIVKSAEQWL